MFRWFETRIDAFPDDPPARPPDTLLAFYAYFIKPVWPAFAVLLVAGFLGSLIEVSAARLRRQPRRHDEGRRESPSAFLGEARRHPAGRWRSSRSSPGRWSRPRTT